MLKKYKIYKIKTLTNINFYNILLFSIIIIIIIRSNILIKKRNFVVKIPSSIDPKTLYYSTNK